MRLKTIVLLLATLPSLGTAAPFRPYIDDVDDHTQRDAIEDGKPWQEGPTTLPDYPQEANLQSFDVDQSSSPFRYFVDTTSLSVGEDNMVRYTLVIESGSGARNLSYEGMRCDEPEYKVYAYGSGEELKPASSADWRPVKSDAYHRDLFEHYLCNSARQLPNKPKDILRRMR